MMPSFPLSMLRCLGDGQLNPGVVLAMATLGLLWFFVAFVGERATFAGRRFFIIANAGLSYWLLLAVLEQWTRAPECKMAFAALAYPGIVIAPTAWMFFVYRYAYGVSGRMRLSQRLALGIAPTVITAAAVTNGWHGLFYLPGSGPIGGIPGAPVLYLHGPLFFGAAAYIYMTMLACIGLLALGAFLARPGYRLHFVILLFLTLAPMTGNLAYVLFGWSIFGFDPTPFLFIFVAFAYGALILSNRLFDLVSVARQSIFDEFPRAVLVVNRNGRVLTYNSAAEQLLDLPPDHGSAQPIPWLTAALPVDATEGSAMRRLELAHEGRLFEADIRPVLSPLGELRPVIGWTVLLEDVSQRRAEEKRLAEALARRSAQLTAAMQAQHEAESLAMRDPLTGLLNRRGLDRLLTHLRDHPAHSSGLGVAAMDIDHFKSINDSFGHAAGDQVLAETAAELRRCFRREDMIFRIGGEEFLILAPGLSAAAMATRLQAARRGLAANPVLAKRLNGRRVQFSAGLAQWHPQEDELQEVILAADGRLYQAKREGRNRTVGGEAREGAA